MQKVKWAAKFSLGIVNLFIGIAFFAWYGTEPIQKFFALPLYLFCGILFLFEAYHPGIPVLPIPQVHFAYKHVFQRQENPLAY